MTTAGEWSNVNLDLLSFMTAPTRVSGHTATATVSVKRPTSIFYPFDVQLRARIILPDSRVRHEEF